MKTRISIQIPIFWLLHKTVLEVIDNNGYFKSSLETNSSSLIPAPIHNKYFVNANISKYWKILPLQFIPKLCNIGFEIFVKFMTLETLKQNFYTCYETLISIAQDKVN